MAQWHGDPNFLKDKSSERPRKFSNYYLKKFNNRKHRQLERYAIDTDNVDILDSVMYKYIEDYWSWD
jgi:hypothetical protein